MAAGVPPRPSGSGRGVEGAALPGGGAQLRPGAALDRPGQPGAGRPRDVGPADQGEGPAVPRSGAHRLRGTSDA